LAAPETSVPVPSGSGSDYNLSRPADALDSALLLAHRIDREDVREALVAQVGMGWALLGEGDKALALADRIPPGQDPFGLSPYGALQRACAAQTHAAMGAMDLAFREFEAALMTLRGAAPHERRFVLLPFAATIVAAHEVTGDPRFATYPQRIRQFFRGEVEREISDRASLRIDLAIFRPEPARQVVEDAMVPVRAAGAQAAPEVLAYALETLGEYTEATGDRSLLSEGVSLLPRITSPSEMVRAQASLGRAMREVGDLLGGERLLRQAQGELPSLSPRDRVLGAMHIARVSARDGHLAGADALLQWARWQLTQVTPVETQNVVRRELAAGFAHVAARLGDPARLEAALVLIRNMPAGVDHDRAFEALGRYMVAYATVASRLGWRLDRMEARVGTSPPWGFKGLLAEAREALASGAIPSARQAAARAGRAVFHHIQEVPDLEELWKMMRDLQTAFTQWDPNRGGKAEFLRYLEEAQQALKVKDWRTLRDRLRRAHRLLETSGGPGEPSGTRPTPPPSPPPSPSPPRT
jgi:hypothetical protein